MCLPKESASLIVFLLILSAEPSVSDPTQARLPRAFRLPVERYPKSYRAMFVKVALDFNLFIVLKPLNGALSSKG